MHKHDKAEKVKQNMKSKNTPQERFAAYVNGVLDNALEMIDEGASVEDQRAAMEDLRSNIDDASAIIFEKGNSKK